MQSTQYNLTPEEVALLREYRELDSTLHEATERLQSLELDRWMRGGYSAINWAMQMDGTSRAPTGADFQPLADRIMQTSGLTRQDARRLILRTAELSTALASAVMRNRDPRTEQLPTLMDFLASLEAQA